MKICIPVASGGHLTQALFLLNAFEGHDVFFITDDTPRTRIMEARTYLFPWGTSNFGNAWRLLKMLPRMISILRREHPDVIFSTGAEAAVPFIYIGKMLGARIVFVESFTRIFKPSVTGKLVYPICDLFIVQHPELLSYYGKKARYEGSIL